jgi:hypothetical protein
MHRFVERYLLVILVGILDRAVLDADRAARALVLDDIPGLPDQGDIKVSDLSFYTLYFRIGKDLYVGMPADLDQLGCEYSHRAVVGREGLIELGHVAAYARRLLDQIYLKAVVARSSDA